MLRKGNDLVPVKGYRSGRMKPCKQCGKEFYCKPALDVGGSLREQRYCCVECGFAANRFTPEQAQAAFWEKVSKTEGCWLWTGAKRWDGYGRFNPCFKQMTAHRYSWELVNGPLPEGMHVLHRCDNPPCVNPAHLFIGTIKDNATDKAQKGRAPAKLTHDQVVEIKQALKAPYFGQLKALAAQYGVSASLIHDIKAGKRRALVQC